MANDDALRILRLALEMPEFDVPRLAERIGLDPHEVDSVLAQYRDFLEALPTHAADPCGEHRFRVKSEREGELNALVAAGSGSSRARRHPFRARGQELPASLVAAEDALLDLGFPDLQEDERRHRIDLARRTVERLKDWPRAGDRSTPLGERLAWLDFLARFCDIEFGGASSQGQLMDELLSSLPSDRARAILTRLARSPLWASTSDFMTSLANSESMVRAGLSATLGSFAVRSRQDLPRLLSQLLSHELPCGVDPFAGVLAAFHSGDAGVQTSLREALAVVMSAWTTSSGIDLSRLALLCADTGTAGAIPFLRMLALRRSARRKRRGLIAALARFAPSREAMSALEDLWVEPTLAARERLEVFDALCRCQPTAYPQWIVGFLATVEDLRSEADVGKAVQQAIQSIGAYSLLQRIFEVPHPAKRRFVELLRVYGAHQFGPFLASDQLGPEATAPSLSRQHEVYEIQSWFLGGSGSTSHLIRRLEEQALN